MANKLLWFLGFVGCVAIALATDKMGCLIVAGYCLALSTMAKKTNADYKRDQYARKKQRQEAMGEKDLVLPVTVGVQSLIDDLLERHGFTDWRELLITMVRVAHADSDLGHKLTTLPASGFAVTGEHAAKLRKARVVMGAALCGGCDDLECPFCFGDS